MVGACEVEDCADSGSAAAPPSANPGAHLVIEIASDAGADLFTIAARQRIVVRELSFRRRAAHHFQFENPKATGRS
jgi:hypothetical protein